MIAQTTTATCAPSSQVEISTQSSAASSDARCHFGAVLSYMIAKLGSVAMAILEQGRQDDIIHLDPNAYIRHFWRSN
jgi:hypothetical protein